MLLRLILLLTLVPLAELVLLVEVTRWWGSLWITIGVILSTGVLGAILARAEGLRVLRRMQREVDAGRMPTEGLFDGVLILMAGALLVTPGLITDAAGFVLLIPPTRALVKELLRRWVRGKVRRGEALLWRSAGFEALSDEPPPGFPPLEDEERD